VNPKHNGRNRRFVDADDVIFGKIGAIFFVGTVGERWGVDRSDLIKSFGLGGSESNGGGKITLDTGNYGTIGLAIDVTVEIGDFNFVVDIAFGGIELVVH